MEVSGYLCAAALLPPEKEPMRFSGSRHGGSKDAYPYHNSNPDDTIKYTTNLNNKQKTETKM
jgi:hypothetical protein